MAGVSLKKDFKDGDKLFGQQLNNNFGAIEAALNAMNKIVWQDDPDDMVVTFRGTTEEINSRDIIDGQLLYDTTTGETYIDYGSQRISTGSGNAIFIGDTEPTNPSTQLWINPDEPMQVISSEVVDSLEGNETNKAPSVKTTKEYIKGDVLFEGSETLTTEDTLELEKSVTNVYRKIEITCILSSIYITVIMYTPFTNETSETIWASGNYLRMVSFTIEDNILTCARCKFGTLSSESSNETVTITQIIGYK